MLVVSQNFMHHNHRPVQCSGYSLRAERFYIILRLLLHSCLTTVQSILFLPQKNLSFRISESFLIDWHNQRTNAFFHSLECPELPQSYCCTVTVLVKKLSKQSAVLQWNSHGVLFRNEMKKSRVPCVFITSETSIVHDRYFNYPFEFDVILISGYFL